MPNLENTLTGFMKCRAKAKRTGIRCQAYAMPNGLCRVHGGVVNTKKHKGNKWARKHGGYVFQFENEEEKRAFDSFRIGFLKEYPELDNEVDRVQLNVVAMNYVRLFRAHNKGESQAIAQIGSEFRNNLRALKLTRDVREVKTGYQSPAEWAAELIARYEKEKG